MAQINITLDQDEILRLLGESKDDAFKSLLKSAFNEVLLAESKEQLKAERYERTEGRTDVRNGTRQRPLTTRIGTIELTVPRHRDVPFKTQVFENYKRSESALIMTMAEMVVAGVSTAKVGRVMEELCGKSFSKQTVSEACREFDVSVKEFKDRPLKPEYPFVIFDATYVKCREDRQIRSKALLIAMGLSKAGAKEIIGLSVEDSETEESWRSFMEKLRARGLKGVKMVTSDSHEGLIAATQEVFPDAAWQRCQAHFSRNIVQAAPKKLQAGLRCELIEMFNSPTLEAARTRRDEIIADYKEQAPKSMKCLENGFEDAMTVMELPEDMQRCTRTSNYIERLNKEIKRRSRVIGVFPNEKSIERMLGALLMEENDRWAAMRKIYYSTAYEELEKRSEVLKQKAKMQRQMKLA